MNDIDVELKNVSMRFRVPTEKVNNLKDYALKKIKRDLRYKEFTALDSVNLTIKKGERIGIIGHNGAGKSTLLKIISGIMKPTEGTVNVYGKIAPLLELGAGFDAEMSGLENIYLNAAILGKQKEEIKELVDEIVEFSELENFIHLPLKNYSSGMKARLGFSIAAHIGAQIIIIDEILGVGDKDFKQKSSQKMKELINGGRTIILVSHSINQIKTLTERTIWLEKGKIKEIGETKDICNKYEQNLN